MNKLFFILLISLLGVMACQHQKDHQDADQASGYACPMKCEGDKVYPSMGTCPVCGMDLVPVGPDLQEKGYVMRFISDPDTPVAGQPAMWSFLPGLIEDSTAVVALEETHEKLLHVIIVSDDLGWYQHVHPDFQSGGNYTSTATLPYGGTYLIFTDYQPKGESARVERKTISVKGPAKKRESFTMEVLSTETDGYKVILNLNTEKLVAGNQNQIGVSITQNGKPVSNLEKLMGVLGHLVIISADGQTYVHVHPEETNSGINFHTSFDQPGFYRAFFQFQTKGEIHTAYFTLKVEAGASTGSDTMKTGHEHH